MITRFLIGTLIVILVIWGVVKFFTWIGQEDEIAVPVNVTNVEEIADAVNDERDERDGESDDSDDSTNNGIVIDEGTTDEGTDNQTESYSGTVPQGQGLIIVGEQITGTVGSTNTEVGGDQGVFIALPPGATYDVQVTNGQLLEVSEDELQTRFCNCVEANLDNWPNARVFDPAEWNCSDS